ncbi:transposase [Cyclobacterium sediminis]
MSPSKEALNRCRERNIPTEALKLRLVRVPIASGEDHILITNLVDHKKYPVKEIRELYRKRWPVEESFKLLKTRAELENLSGKTARAVLQDFNRIILRANLSNILSKTLTKKGIDYCNKKRKKHLSDQQNPGVS